MTVPAFAQHASMVNTTYSSYDPGEKPGLFMTTTYDFELPADLKLALRRGISLHFVFEARTLRKRWYWMDKRIDTIQDVKRLSYNPITRRYRVIHNGLSNEFDTLEQALPVIKNIRNVRIADEKVLDEPDVYSVECRFYFDHSKLPKPMQVASSSGDWNIDSNWVDVEIPKELLNEGSTK